VLFGNGINERNEFAREPAPEAFGVNAGVHFRAVNENSSDKAAINLNGMALARGYGGIELIQSDAA
jgi:hypothetical protein